MGRREVEEGSWNRIEEMERSDGSESMKGALGMKMKSMDNLGLRCVGSSFFGITNSSLIVTSLLALRIPLFPAPHRRTSPPHRSSTRNPFQLLLSSDRIAHPSSRISKKEEGWSQAYLLLSRTSTLSSHKRCRRLAERRRSSIA